MLTWLSQVAMSQTAPLWEVVGFHVGLRQLVSRVMTNKKVEGAHKYSGDNLHEAEIWEYFVSVLRLNQRRDKGRCTWNECAQPCTLTTGNSLERTSE